MLGVMPWTRERKELAPRERNPFRLIRHEFEEMLDALMGRLPMLPEAWTFTPKVTGLELEEKEKEVVVRAELPGFEAKEVEATVKGETLTIKAAREVAGKEGEEKETVRVCKSVTLPVGVEAEKAEAFYRNGVLEVKVPKVPEAMGRRIEVKT